MNKLLLTTICLFNATGHSMMRSSCLKAQSVDTLLRNPILMKDVRQRLLDASAVRLQILKDRKRIDSDVITSVSVSDYNGRSVVTTLDCMVHVFASNGSEIAQLEFPGAIENRGKIIGGLSGSYAALNEQGDGLLTKAGSGSVQLWKIVNTCLSSYSQVEGTLPRELPAENGLGDNMVLTVDPEKGAMISRIEFELETSADKVSEAISQFPETKRLAVSEYDAFMQVLAEAGSISTDWKVGDMVIASDGSLGVVALFRPRHEDDAGNKEMQSLVLFDRHGQELAVLGKSFVSRDLSSICEINLKASHVVIGFDKRDDYSAYVWDIKSFLEVVNYLEEQATEEQVYCGTEDSSVLTEEIYREFPLLLKKVLKNYRTSRKT